VIETWVDEHEHARELLQRFARALDRAYRADPHRYALLKNLRLTLDA
jgi:hypothetical protein